MPIAFRQHDALIFEDEVAAADEHALVADAAGNAVGHKIFHLGVEFVVAQLAALGFGDDGVGHGMRKMFFQTGGQAQHFCGVFTAERNDFRHLRRGAGEGAGFVENNGVGLGDGFEKFAAFDGDVVFCGFANGAEHCQRHGQLEGAAEIDHQHRQRAGWGARQGQRCQTGGEGVWHEFVGQIGGLFFAGAFELLRMLDHGDDLVVAALAAGFLDEDDAFAFFDDGAGIDDAVRVFGDGDRFAGQRGLVDGGFPFQHDAIQRNDTAGTQHDAITRLHAAHRRQHIETIVGAQPDAVHIEGHGARQIGDGFLTGPFFQQLAHFQQEHDRAGGGEIASEGGNAQGDGVQQLHLELTVAQTAQAAPEKRHKMAQETHHAQRRR